MTNDYVTCGHSCLSTPSVFRKVYDFLASFLTTGMRFLLNKQVCLSTVSDSSVFLIVLSVCLYLSISLRLSLRSVPL